MKNAKPTTSAAPTRWISVPENARRGGEAPTTSDGGIDWGALAKIFGRRKPQYVPIAGERALRKRLQLSERRAARARAIENGRGARGTQRLR